MPLSIEKLDMFLARNEMITSAFFVDDKMRCVLIEIYITSNDETFLLYIPSKYKITIDNGTNVFKVKYGDIDISGDVIDRYSTENIKNKVNQGYDEIDIMNNRKQHNNNVESLLEENYNRPVKLNHKQNNGSNELYRQIQRLAMCVTAMKYKLCVYTSDYMYLIDKRNNILFLHIDSHPQQMHKYRKLLVVVDIETLYDKIKTSADDIHQIKTNVHNILKRNIDRNVTPIPAMINSGNILIKKHQDITTKLNEYSSRYNVIQKSVEELKNQERKILEKKIEIRDQKQPNRMNFLSNDIERTKQMRDLDIKLQRITEAKKELFRNIVSLRVKYDNLLLQMDSIIFDIVVMSETINDKIKYISQL